MKSALALLLVALATALAFAASPAYAQIELTEANPADGAKLDVAPDVVHLCFSEPVNVDDNTTFDFAYQMPDGVRLGLRIIFQPDGECVDVQPGLPKERPAGEYTFEWRVTAAKGDEEGSGTLRFQVSTASTPAPSRSPTAVETSLPGTPSPAAGETPLPVTPSPGGGAETGDTGDDDGPDILVMALATIACVGIAAVLFTIGYLLRKRIGYEPHRPPEDGGEGEDH